MHAAPGPVSLAEAFRYWLKLGFISFGGPAGQISLMHQELVEKRRCWDSSVAGSRRIVSGPADIPAARTHRTAPR
jgi:hypothetical protein